MINALCILIILVLLYYIEKENKVIKTLNEEIERLNNIIDNTRE